jgi:hypothetical protein
MLLSLRQRPGRTSVSSSSPMHTVGAKISTKAAIATKCRSDLAYASSHFLQAPFQPRAAQKLHREVCRDQHGKHPEKCPLGRCGAKQLLKPAAPGMQ